MDTLSVIFVFVATLLLLWRFIFTPYYLRKTRAELFAIRDNAFVHHRHHKDHAAFREHINLVLRYAELISWQRFVMNFLLFHKQITSAPQPSVAHLTNKHLQESLQETTAILVRLTDAFTLIIGIGFLCCLAAFVIPLLLCKCDERQICPTSSGNSTFKQRLKSNLHKHTNATHPSSACNASA